MSKKVKEWARRARYSLIYELGGKCVVPECGEEEYEKLTFDHIDGKDWETTGLSTDQRMIIYRREAKAGLLQIMCNSCNAKKGDPRMAPERERCRLLIHIGNRCATPDCENRYIGDLQFIHVDGPDWEPPGLVYEARLALYQKAVAEGKLIVMCDDCLESDRVIVPFKSNIVPVETQLSEAVPF
jgi:hypothetical protein